jgi:hypothetical protein
MQPKLNSNNDSVPVDEKTELTRQFVYDEHFRNSKYYAEFRLPFIKNVRNLEIERKIHERFIILMQASGNSGIAFFIAAIPLIVRSIQQSSPLLFGIAICFLVISIILILNF